MDQIKVHCPRCGGRGFYDPNPPDSHHVRSGKCGLYDDRGCPMSLHQKTCETCNGYGVLVAKELKSVTLAGPCNVEGRGAMVNPELDNYSGRPQIVTLCGSTRFTDEMLKEAWRLTLEGKIVIHWNVVNFVGDHAAESLGDDVKARIDDLYLHKVAMADVVHIINVGGYVGESTRKELAHARKLGKPVTWLEPDAIPDDLR